MDNPLGLESKTSYVKIKPPGIIIGLTAVSEQFLDVNKEQKMHTNAIVQSAIISLYHGSVAYDPLAHFLLCYRLSTAL